MEAAKLVVRYKRGEMGVLKAKGMHGMIELDMLITTNLTPKAKYLYLIYCATANGYDANIWGRHGICSTCHISNSTYHKAHKELKDNGILQTRARAAGNGIQTSNINVIIRTEKWEIERPPSWVPLEPFDLERWCLEHLDDEGRIQPEIATCDFSDGTGDATQEEQEIQRTITINSNHNSEPFSSIQEQTNGSLTTSTLEPPEKELNFELASKVIKRKLKSTKQAREAIDTLNKSGFEGIAKEGLTDEIIERAFVAFEYFKEAVESYDKDTTGYALNIDDLNRFVGSGLSKGYSEKEVEYHISRVVELGFERLNKPYIGFSYVINTDHGVHSEFKG
jgi:hypothetical protein